MPLPHRPDQNIRCWLSALLLLWAGQVQGLSPDQLPSRPQRSRVAESPGSFAGYEYVRLGQALPVQKPGERVLLVLQNGTKRLSLTRNQLLTLPALRYKTTQPQLQRAFTYEGVPLRDLAQLGGFPGKDLRIYASNGFVVTIPASEYMSAAIMLAHSANGLPIPVLQKGPLEVVLPPEPRFADRKYGSIWVWFVNRITPAP